MVGGSRFSELVATVIDYLSFELSVLGERRPRAPNESSPSRCLILSMC